MLIENCGCSSQMISSKIGLTSDSQSKPPKPHPILAELTGFSHSASTRMLNKS